MVFANFGQKISGDELTFNICAPNMHIKSLNERKLKRLKIRLRTNQLQNCLRERERANFFHCQKRLKFS